MKKRIIVIIAFTLIGMTIGFGGSYGYHIYNDFKHGSLAKDSVTIEVASGSSNDNIISLLKDNGLIRYPFAFKMAVKDSGKSHEFKAGKFTLEKGMGYYEIIDALINSPVPKGVSVTIPEGYELHQITDYLINKGVADREKLSVAIANALNCGCPFTEYIPAERDNPLEGYLFPDTYTIDEGMTEAQILIMMLNRFDAVFSVEYRERAKELGMTIDEVVILASVIEREGGNNAEFPKVSGVFHNRLEIGMPLQSCATVQYVLNERKPVLSDADTKIDSPYNTYKYPGLPIGPIASPGEAAIKAALYPEDHEYFYFVVGPEGDHIFSITYEEHLNAQH